MTLLRHSPVASPGPPKTRRRIHGYYEGDLK